MAVDPNRALLVSQEYRYSSVSDATVRAKFPDASEITIETNLDEASALALAQSIFNASSKYARAMSFVIEQPIYVEEFIVAPPRFTVTFKRFPEASGLTYTVAAAVVNHSKGITQVKVRGS